MEPSVARLRALEAAGGLAYWAGDMRGAGVHYAAAADEARRLGDDREIANALFNHWFTRRPTNSIADWGALLADDDRELLDEALAIWTRLGDEEGVARALWGLGEHYAYREEYAAAEDVTTRALAIFERTGERFWIAWTRFTRSFARSLGRRRPGLRRGLRRLPARVPGQPGRLRPGPHDGRDVEPAADRRARRGRLRAGGRRGAGDGRDRAPHRQPVAHAVAARAGHGSCGGSAPRCRGAGRAWTREEALDVAIAIADELAAAPPPGVPTA